MSKILVGVTGSISAYKSVDVISALKKTGHEVSAIATPNALEFVTERALASAADVYWNMYENKLNRVPHIEATEDIDIFLICPATANTVAKMAHGFSDNLLLDAVLATKKDVMKIISPCMNTRMWFNPIFQNNLSLIRKGGDFFDSGYGWHVIEPVEGKLACGTIGKGKLPSTREIVDYVNLRVRNEKE